jgi:hypothetical protein
MEDGSRSGTGFEGHPIELTVVVHERDLDDAVPLERFPLPAQPRLGGGPVIECP